MKIAHDVAMFEDSVAGLVEARLRQRIGKERMDLWFGGDAGAGLSRYDGKSFTRFKTKDGLINNDVWSILEDRAGNIWVGTRNTSLFRYDGKTFTSYTDQDKQTESLFEINQTPSAGNEKY